MQNSKFITKIEDFQLVHLTFFLINFVSEVEISTAPYLKCLSLNLAVEDIIEDFNISHLPIKWKCHIYDNIYLILNDISSVFSQNTIFIYKILSDILLTPDVKIFMYPISTPTFCWFNLIKKHRFYSIVNYKEKVSSLPEQKVVHFTFTSFFFSSEFFLKSGRICT